jgi:hypothetical protein
MNVEALKRRKKYKMRDTRPLNFPRRKLASHKRGKFPLTISEHKLSWRRELNPRPSDYKSDALPTELRQHGANQKRITNRAFELQGD